MNKAEQQDQMQDAFKNFFDVFCESIGEDSHREGLQDTPRRVVNAFIEIFDGYAKNPKDVMKTFSDGACDEMVIVKEIPFFSMCEHHMLPFFGHINVGYLPNKEVIGISSLTKIIEILTHRLQIQEKLTEQIAQLITDELHPKGVIVVSKAHHLCMSMRGARVDAPIITSALRGLFKKDEKIRTEFMQLLK